MVSRMPLYREVKSGENFDAELLRGDTFVPLRLCFDTTDAYTERDLPPGDVDAETAQTASGAIIQAQRAIAAVESAHTPSPATLKSIAVVEAVRASMPSAATRASIAAVESARAAMPDERTQATIAPVSKTIAAVSPCVEAVERESARDL
jgi:hypothetical protein